MNLRRMREARGLSQRELARKAGVTQSYISHIETRRQKNITVRVAKKLARALGVTLMEVLE